MKGLLPVFKKIGPSSSMVVQALRRIIGGQNWKNIKIGHGGTLDTFASGVLVLGIGDSTKLLSYFMKCEKRYIATGKFGIETASGDITGPIIRESVPFQHITLSQLNETLLKFSGTIEQVPPMYSALHYQGERLYKLARKGVTVPLNPRKVCVYSIQCTRFDPPEFDLEIVCGGGTYVRKLIMDIGKELNCCATTIALQRTVQGPFTLEHCLNEDQWTVENIQAAIEKLETVLKNHKETHSFL